MKTSKMRVAVVWAALALMGVPAAGDNVPPAFPGAEGFGANTPGGRGGKVLLVTNLDGNSRTDYELSLFTTRKHVLKRLNS